MIHLEDYAVTVNTDISQNVVTINRKTLSEAICEKNHIKLAVLEMMQRMDKQNIKQWNFVTHTAKATRIEKKASTDRVER